MPKLPVLRSRKLIKVAQKLGFKLEAIHGSHFVFRRPTDGKMISIPSHKGKDLGKGLVRAIIKSMNISEDEFIKLL